MKIEFTPEGGAAVTLGDDAAGLAVVVPPLPKVTAMIEPNALPRAAATDHIPRANLESVFSLVVSKNFYPNLGDAALWVALQGAAVAGKKGSLTITEGTDSATMVNATCQGVTPRLLEGVEVEMQYDFMGGVFEVD